MPEYSGVPTQDVQAQKVQMNSRLNPPPAYNPELGPQFASPSPVEGVVLAHPAQPAAALDSSLPATDWAPNAKPGGLHIAVVAASIATVGILAIVNLGALHRCTPLDGCRGVFLSEVRQDLCNDAGLSAWNASTVQCECRTGWEGKFCEGCADHFTAPICVHHPEAHCHGRPFERDGCTAVMESKQPNKSDTIETSSGGWLSDATSPWAIVGVLVIVLVVILGILCCCC